MAIERRNASLRYLGPLFVEGVVSGATDRELLERFNGRSGEASELAFAALVERHGPMVLDACRAALRDEHDARDAFQAVFLVLVHKARSLWVRDSIGPWLHAVALRVAAGARASSARRKAHERRRAEVVPPPDGESAGLDEELRAALHEEVGRLPENYRQAIVLCDLEGLTHAEAARRLGWPVGTVKSRQGRGRERLRRRLLRRGLTPAAGAALMSGRVGAAVPGSLVGATVRVAALVSGGRTAARAVSATVALLMRGAVRAMLMARLRLAGAAAFVVCGVVATAGLAIHSGAAAPGAGQAVARPKLRKASLDALRPEDIPPEKRTADLPPGAVAVLGEIRGRHAGEVRGLAVSPDGKLLATASDNDKRVRLWDAATLMPAGSLAGHRAFVNCVAISSDGHWLASGGAYGDFFLWDLSASPPRGPILLPTHGKDGKFNNTFHATAFSPDGKRLAVAGDAGSFELFDMTAEPPASRGVLPGLAARVRALAFSRDGKTLALAGLDDGSVRLCGIGGASPVEKARLTLPEVESVVVVPMARRADGGGGDAPAFRKVVKTPIPVLSAAFSPDGPLLAALDESGATWTWDLAGERTRLRGAPRGRQGPIKVGHNLREWATIVFSHDGRTLAAAQPDGAIRLWDHQDGHLTERSSFEAHKVGPVTGVLAFSPDDRALFSGGGDHLVRAWDLSARRPEERFPPRGAIGGISGVAFSPDGKRLAVADSERVRLWDLTDPAGLSRAPGPEHGIPHHAAFGLPMAFSPDGRTLYVGGDPWDVGTTPPRHLQEDPTLWGGMPHSLSLSADGRTMAVGGNFNKVRLYDVKDGKVVQRIALDGDGQWAPVAALSPDGAYLAFAGPGHSIRVWVLAGLEPKVRAQIEGNGWPISCLMFSPDGKILAAGTSAGMRLWTIDLGRPTPLHPSRGLLGFSTSRPINESLGFSIAFTPDGKRLVAADEIFDKAGQKPSRPAIRVFDVASGDRLAEWEIGVPCWSVAMAPDGRHVAAARRDGTTLILRLP